MTSSIGGRRLRLLSAAVVALSVGVGAASGALPSLRAPTVPSDPAPRLPDHPGGPPSAWLETRGVERWLGPSTFSWDGEYVRIVYHAYLPSFTLRRGQLVTFHLGFAPSRPVELDVGPATYRLAKRQEATWKVPMEGRIATHRGWREVTLRASGERGDAFYVARFRVRL